MSQTWTDDCYGSTHVVATDMANIENNFAALKSMFSGSSAPANTVPGMMWYDSTQLVLKERNHDDSDWVGIMHGDAAQKIWVYRNAAMDGWVVDSSVTDVVLGVKGGAVYTAGATVAGSWGISGLTNSWESTHTHVVPSHNHGANTGSTTITPSGEGYTPGTGYVFTHTHTISAQATVAVSAPTSHSHTITSDSTWRVAAAVGTLQYLDLT